MIHYNVLNAEGKVMREGDPIVSFRGEPYTFVNCFHPRKIYARDAQGRGREYYPSVFELLIVVPN